MATLQEIRDECEATNSCQPIGRGQETRQLGGVPVVPTTEYKPEPIWHNGVFLGACAVAIILIAVLAAYLSLRKKLTTPRKS